MSFRKSCFLFRTKHLLFSGGFVSGYELKGLQRDTCLANGTWLHGTPPECVHITCPVPVPTKHGKWQRSTELSVPGDVASLVCEAGYEPALKGNPHNSSISPQLVCATNGSWIQTGNEGFCQPVSCPAPVVENGLVEGKSWNYLSHIKVTCVLGHYLTQGDGLLQCSSNQTWLPAIPECHVITCGNPPQLRNGYVNTTGLNYNDTAYYYCDKHYTLHGSVTSRCTESGKWERITPLSCQLITCSHPGSIANGDIYARAAPVSHTQQNYR